MGSQEAGKKFHLTIQGEPAICKATKRKCPRGGKHFDNFEEASTSPEASELKKEYEYNSMVKKELKSERLHYAMKVGAIGLTSVAVLSGIHAVGQHHIKNVEKDYLSTSRTVDSTPYSITLNRGENKLSTYRNAVITNKDLTKTELSNCVGSKYEGRSIKCSTADGKITVTFYAHGKMHNIKDLKTQVKDDGGRTVTVSYNTVKASNPHNGVKTFISTPKNISN